METVKLEPIFHLITIKVNISIIIDCCCSTVDIIQIFLLMIDDSLHTITIPPMFSLTISSVCAKVKS